MNPFHLLSIYAEIAGFVAAPTREILWRQWEARWDLSKLVPDEGLRRMLEAVRWAWFLAANMGLAVEETRSLRSLLYEYTELKELRGAP